MYINRYKTTLLPAGVPSVPLLGSCESVPLLGQLGQQEIFFICSESMFYGIRCPKCPIFGTVGQWDTFGTVGTINQNK